MGYKKTLLQLVQEILSSTDGGEINSYLDTTESLQVARILENTYWDIVSTSSFGAMFTFYELTASGNTSYPTIMTLPSAAVTLESLKYDYATIADPQPNLYPITFLTPDQFLQRMYSIDASSSNVTSFNYPIYNSGTLSVVAYKDTAPRYYTTYDDNTIIFDSYDASVDTTLQANKTLAYGEVNPTWTYSDNFIPNLPEKQFTILRNEAKATAYVELKQTTNSDATKKARRGWISSQKTGNKLNNPRNNLTYTPNYAKGQSPSVNLKRT
jgi:hypothetical protein